MNALVERATKPTPKFFRILRTVGISLLAGSGAIIASPVAVPVLLTTIAGYLAVAGGVLTAVSQITVDESAQHKSQKSADESYEHEL
ncbi:MAG: hypothetical protein LBE34_02150 [Flavobacteriaceae bacterium]|jgi:uncharacterized membrane protein HdeD (DUF308 family)|nr:hypothetical protein [Flavobacteriaceae bacterium]